MTKAKKPKDRIEVVPEGRKGWQLVVFFNGRPVLKSTENYRSVGAATRGANRVRFNLASKGLVLI